MRQINGTGMGMGVSSSDLEKTESSKGGKDPAMRHTKSSAQKMINNLQDRLRLPRTLHH